MQKQKDVKRSEFSSLDIFLFSNGQQHSPPRKYNLRADELSWWEATLNNLARSQYGSNHAAIELYTIEGQRVQGPHELCAGAAYVAVQPPDLFLQCGYDKYLMKASRYAVIVYESWEKRQERKGNNGAFIEQDKSNFSNKAEVKDVTSIQIYQDITIHPTPSTTVEEQVVVKPNPDIKYKTNESRISSGKQLQKRKVSSPQQNPSILRKKYVNPVNPMTKNTDSLSKDLSKVNITKMKTDSRIKRTLEKEKSLLKSTTPTPRITQIIERDDEVSTEKRCSSSQVVHEEFQENQQSPTIVVLGEMPENSQLQTDSNAAEKDGLSRLYNNEEHHQSVFISPNIPSTIRDNKDRLVRGPYDTDHKVIINSSVIDVDEKSVYSRSQSEHVEVHGIEGETNITRAIDESETFHKKTIVAGSQTVESIVVLVNQGENVNLTLNIEIKNVPGSASVNIQNVRPSQSNVTKSGTEPVDNDMIVDNGSLNKSSYEDALLKSCQPHSTQLKKKYDRFQETMEYMDMVVCQCCSNSEKIIPMNAVPIYFEKSNYFILLPAEKGNGNLLGCNCILEMKCKNKIHSSTNDKDILVVPKTMRDSLELLKNKLSLSKIDSKRLHSDQCPRCLILSTSMEEVDRQVKETATEKCIPVRYPGVPGCKAMSPSSPDISKVFNEASTQTDWTNILLEAQLCDDGHYSFHMPPLEILKQYDAL